MHTEENTLEKSENIFSWTFDDKKNRGSLWYIVALSVVIGLSIWGFFTKQYGMSIVILLIAGLFYFVENNSEDIIEVEIKELGIKISGTFYDYESIESFGIVYRGDNPIFLRLNLIKKGLKNIDVKINMNIINDVKSMLSKHIEETPKIEFSFSEKFIKLLKL